MMEYGALLRVYHSRMNWHTSVMIYLTFTMIYLKVNSRWIREQIQSNISNQFVRPNFLIAKRNNLYHSIDSEYQQTRKISRSCRPKPLRISVKMLSWQNISSTSAMIFSCYFGHALPVFFNKKGGGVGGESDAGYVCIMIWGVFCIVLSSVRIYAGLFFRLTKGYFLMHVGLFAA